MTNFIVFEPYHPIYQAECLSLFDINCPEFFSPNERADYIDFLAKVGVKYLVVKTDKKIIAAFGVLETEVPKHYRLNWIMVDKKCHGIGIGKAIMQEAARLAQLYGASKINIAASHISAPFFARYGAKKVSYIEHGWGENMHRVDMELDISLAT